MLWDRHHLAMFFTSNAMVAVTECKHDARAPVPHERSYVGQQKDRLERSDGLSTSDARPAARSCPGALGPLERAAAIERVGRFDGGHRVQERGAGGGHQLRTGRPAVAHRDRSGHRAAAQHGFGRRDRRRRLPHDERARRQQRAPRPGGAAWVGERCKRCADVGQKARAHRRRDDRRRRARDRSRAAQSRRCRTALPADRRLRCRPSG